MPDSRKWTNDQLEKLEKELYNIYNEAGVGLTLKAREFLADMQRMDEVRRKQVKDGEWTEEQYKEWRKNKLLYFGKYKRLMETVQREMLEVNKKAIEILNGETPKIFAHNYNSIVESFPDSPVEGFTFELVDAETVKRLATSGELMLPPKKDFDPKKDAAWNGKQVNAQILQGILQGESIPKIAARMADICESNHVAMVRTARTLVTAAENSGRQAGMNKAEEGGMIFEKIWMAATDARTRDSHLDLNGKKVKNGEKFKSITGAELEFPGDWRAPGYEVYNCRCSLGTHYIGFKKGLIHKEPEKPAKKPKKEPKKEPEKVPKKAASKKSTEKVKRNYNCAVAQAIGKEQYDAIMDMLDKCKNEKVKKLYEKFMDEVKVGNAKHKGGAYASLSTIFFNIDSDSSGSSLRKPFSVFFHECAHAIDSFVNRAKGGLIINHHSETWNEKKFRNTLENEIKDYIKDRENKLKAELKNKRSNLGWLVGNGILDPYDVSKLREIADENGIELKDLLEGKVKIKEATKFLPKITKKIAMQNVENELRELRKSEKGDYKVHAISDMFEGVTKGGIQAGWGHGKTYWNRVNVSVEAFAEISESYVSGPESLETLQKYIPKTLEAYDELLDDMIGGL